MSGLPLWLAPLLAGAAMANELPPAVTVGSKADTETVILERVIGRLAERAGADVRYHSALGGTQLVWRSLLAGEIDLYTEYTGTLTGGILASEHIADEADLRRVLEAEFGVRMTRPLGFNNTYALAMPRRRPAGDDRLTDEQWETIHSISDLRRHPELRLGFSNEFLERDDGWPGLRRTYALPHADVRGMVHDLAYVAIRSGSIDVTDAYATDAELRAYDLKTLDDNLGFFPSYEAVVLYRADLEERAPEVVAAIRTLEGRISAEEMTAMNHRAKQELVPENQIAADYLAQEFEIGRGVAPGSVTPVELESRPRRLWRYTREHLMLVGVSLAAAVLVAVPLGILAAQRRWLGHAILVGVGLLQTVPSIAFFFLLIPLLGLHPTTAIVALFLYSLLPIVRNTCAGLQNIPRSLREEAEVLGLSAWARLQVVELPLASRTILAGIKTAAVINVGTATLGGLIGAGGYGEPIFRGIHKDSGLLLLEGAIPAALMALAVQWLFDLAERVVVPRGLRLPAEH